MILAALILIPVAAGLAGFLAAPRKTAWTRGVCLAAMIADLALACWLWAQSAGPWRPGGGAWPASSAGSGLPELNCEWIPAWGARLHLAMDGLSLLMVLLCCLLGVLCVAASWRPVRRREGFYYLNLMLVLAGTIGVFLAADLLLFYFFWELMLVPMYFLIDVWGHEDRHRSAVKFFLFTQAGGLLLLLAILGLYFLHGQAAGRYTFDAGELLGTAISPRAALLVLAGFLGAFLVKLPAVPLHTWLPDAHTEAPTAGSVILAGLMLKTGAYGLLRLAMPLLPATVLEADRISTAMMALGAAGVLYGAVQAFAQTDFKRMVAYTSVSHLGFVLLGVFSRNRLGMQGAVMQMICHGLSTGALFLIAGMLQDRLGTRDLAKMGGLWASMPRMGGAAMFFAMASLGLPGLGNFVAEFLVLLGAFQASPIIAGIATAGLVPATLYSLWMIHRVFHGTAKPGEAGHGPAPGPAAPAPAEAGHRTAEEDGRAPTQGPRRAPDLRAGELAILAILAGLLLWLGLFPQAVLDTAEPSVNRLVAPDVPKGQGGLAGGEAPGTGPTGESSPKGAKEPWGEGPVSMGKGGPP